METLHFAHLVVKVGSVIAPLAISILVCRRKGKKEKATKKSKGPSECHVKTTTSMAVSEDKKCKSVQQSNESHLTKNMGSTGCIKVQELTKEEHAPDGTSIQASSRNNTEIAGKDKNVKQVEDYQKDDSFKKSIESSYIKQDHKRLLKSESLNEVNREPQREISVWSKELCFAATPENTPKKDDIENKSPGSYSFKIDDESWKIWAATSLGDSSAISDAASPVDSGMILEPSFIGFNYDASRCFGIHSGRNNFAVFRTKANQHLPPAVINRLHRELREILTNPDACIHVFLPNDDNLLVWKVAIFGPPDSVYQGGYFPAEIRFPNNYPFSPPSFKFLRSPWHTNIAENGGVCISTLKAEQWNAVHSVRTILLSIVSLLTDPNVNSALNPTANSEYVRWRNNQGNQFADRVRREVEASRADAERDGVVVPQTHEEYLRRSEELNAAVEAARQAANVQAAQDENASDALTAEIEADTQPAEESDDETDENGERTQENDEGTDEDDCQLITCTSSL